MEPERWRQISALYYQAQQARSEAERAAILSDLCAGDEALRREVESLLAQPDGPDFTSLPRTFSSGQIVADRFRILAFLGEGGMGEVYEAEDLVLRRDHVALKTLRSIVSADRELLDNLKHEISVARRVTHPNVCRVFEIERHAPSSGTPIWFITMELLEGETLRQRLERCGRLTTTEALPLVKQTVAALAAAHAADVVHGDFKPGNVLIVPTAEGKERAVVTDFGLSRWTPAGSALRTTTIGRLGWGTPAYMAPELLESQPVSVASDIYALGAVIYEMVTGKLPFQGNSPLEVALNKVRGAPRSPNDLGIELDSRWQAAIGRCLNVDPSARFQTVTQVGEALEAYRSSPIKWSSVAAAAAAVLLVLARPPALTAPRTIAILPFAAAPQGSESVALGLGLSAAVADQLSVASGLDRRVRVVPASEVVGAGLDTVPPRSVLGADMVVAGDIADQSDRTRITITLNDVSGQDTSVAERRSFDVQPGQGAIAQTVTHVLAMLKVSLAARDERAVTAGLAAEPGAEEYYLRGRGYLEAGTASLEPAIEALERAVQIDARYGLAYSALGEAYLRKYQATRDPAFVSRAQTNSERAVTLASGLARSHVLRGRVFAATSQNARAIREFQEALRLKADLLEGRMGLAAAYEREGALQEAETSYREAARLHREYWSAHSGLGSFLFRHGRYAEAETSFLNGLQRAPANVVIIRNLAGLYILTDRFAAAEAELRKGLTLRDDPTLYNNLGWVYVLQGEFERAVEPMEQATRLPDADSRVWGNLARAYRWAGRHEQARSAYQTAMRIAKADVSVNPWNAELRANLALLWAEIGRRPEALAEITSTLERAPTDVTVRFVSALTYELVNDRAAALEALELAARGGHSMVEIRRHPDLHRLRDDPGYGRLLALPAPDSASR